MSGPPGFEDLDGVARAELDHGALLVGAAPRAEPGPRDLPLAVHGPDALHVHVPDLLDRFLDLGLVRLGRDQERVRVPLEPGVGLLRDDGPDDDVARALHWPTSVSSWPSCGSARTSPSSEGSAAFLDGFGFGFASSASAFGFRAPASASGTGSASGVGRISAGSSPERMA